MALDQLVGESEWTKRVRDKIRQVAQHRYSVLVTGPSGTGKELVAKAVHLHSARSEQPFVPVNCATIPSGLFSSQLFGHVKGAFTGAQYAALGCFRAAHGGTIFLDEIGELDLDGQAKLLRVLQERVVTPVGGTEEIGVDVRTIAATNRNLVDEVREGRFRLDLYYRLNVLAIEMTPLASREADILPLANHFLAKTAVEGGMPLKELSEDAIELLKSYAWPGNVRELENQIERAVVMTDSDYICVDAFPDIFEKQFRTSLAMPDWRGDTDVADASELPVRLATQTPVPRREPETGPPRRPAESWLTLAEVERRHLEQTLEKTYYNQSAAARLLDIDRKLLSRKIKRHKIEIPRR